MKKEVNAIFTLTDEEIRNAFYDVYVRNLKSENINAIFSEQSIFISEIPIVQLTIREGKDID